MNPLILASEFLLPEIMDVFIKINSAKPKKFQSNEWKVCMSFNTL